MKLITARRLKHPTNLCDGYSYPSHHTKDGNNKISLFDGNVIYLCNKHFAQFKKDIKSILEK